MSLMSFTRWLAGFCLACHALNLPAQPLTLDCNHDLGTWNLDVLAHYQALGVSAECVFLPRARGSVQVAAGELDGSAMRGHDFGVQFPHLIRVEPPIKAVPLVVFRRIGTDITVANWRAHSIATIRGAIVFDQLLAGLDVTRLSTIEAAVKQLSAGRVDVLVGDTVLVPALLQQMGVDNVEMVTPPVTTVLLYHYLQEKHRALASRLSERLLETQR
ncbi:transporter substrate-binding domain-containing protein [Simiduia agarivorans]|uniref:Uncharacterized protein n=1 Tax=Simiduia agarivorans (strain DSM 21679 / JCM 13881 / BCRC 17597 / SA1) TaxID=1117647 RepID=K4KMH9_SIMAS|nr:transporter substrate-binding domain-containing protein [Simiduia agarivorans]AFV00212.1 hypothetical protein M5M_15395 [Simiduia agarivorans SA1 = DSM 21679]